MNQKLKNRLLRTAILCLIGLAVGAAVAYYQMQFETARVLKQGDSVATNAAPVAGLKIGGPFTLTDHNGNKITEESFAGQYKLIYFGFTYCPAICPTELQKITKVLNELGPYGDQIQPLLITIDPERDTPDVLKEYVSLFHPRLIGLTGTQPQIDNVLKNYRIFATKVEDDNLNEYTMDHSTFIYLMGPNNDLMSIYRLQDTADFMLEDIRRKVVMRPSPQP